MTMSLVFLKVLPYILSTLQFYDIFLIVFVNMPYAYAGWIPAYTEDNEASEDLNCGL